MDGEGVDFGLQWEEVEIKVRQQIYILYKTTRNIVTSFCMGLCPPFISMNAIIL